MSKHIRISMLPSLITLGNLVCGFLAIAYIADGASLNQTDPLYWAALLLFVAMVCDALDGKVARMTGAASDFGGQLDSLADVVTFGLAPAFLVKVLLEMSGMLPKLAWAVAALFVCCAALRLARFNVDNDTDEESHEGFMGLPTPAAAGALGSLTMLILVLGQPPVMLTLLPVAVVVLAALMVSQVRYVHMGTRLLSGRRSFADLAQIVFVVFLLVLVPEYALAGAFTLYALSGPALTLARAASPERRRAMLRQS